MSDSATPQGWTWRAPAGWTWDHHAIADQRDRKRLQEDAALPAFARAVLTSADEMPHIEFSAEAVAGIAPDFTLDEEDHPGALAALRFAVLPDRLVTARRVPLACTWQAFCEAREGAAPPTAAAMAERIFQLFAARALAQAGALAQRLDTVEDGLLAADATGAAADRTELGQVRRAATRLQRGIAPLLRMLVRDAEGMPDWAVEAEGGSGHLARRRLQAAQDDLAALQARARALQDELSAIQAEQTNRRLYVLSVATMLFLPPTLVTGFFGMNTSALPFADGERGTLWAGLALAGAVSLALLALRRFRLL